MRNLHMKYSSVHEICKLVRVLDMQQFHRAWSVVLQFCRRIFFVSSKPNSYSGEPRVLLIQFSRLLTACIPSFSLCYYRWLSPTHMGFVVDRVALWQVLPPFVLVFLVSVIPPLLHTHSFTYHPRYIMFLSQYFSFPLSLSFHQRSPIAFTHLPPTVSPLCTAILTYNFGKWRTSKKSRIPIPQV